MIDNVLDGAMKKFQKIEESTDRSPELRPSGMPICPRQFFINYVDFLENGGTWSASGDFYCGIGTSVHETIQKWLPNLLPGAVLGNWECKRCGRRKESVVGPQICKCKTEMEYEEFTLDFLKVPIVGHCDGVLVDLDFIQKEYGIDIKADNVVEMVNDLLTKSLKKKIPVWVLEYKTGGMWVIKNLQEPRHGYKCQATIYTSCSRKCFPKLYNLRGIKVEGYIIKYFGRDNIYTVSRDFVKRVETDSLFNNTIKIVKLILDVLKDPSVSNVKKIHKFFPCRKWPLIYPECDLEDICEELSKKEFLKDCKRVSKHYKLTLKKKLKGQIYRKKQLKLALKSLKKNTTSYRKVNNKLSLTDANIQHFKNIQSFL